MIKQYYIFGMILCFLALSCTGDFLDVKPDKKLVVPETLADMQALLDYTDLMNRSIPMVDEMQADDGYLTDQVWNSMGNYPDFKNAYIWQDQIYETKLLDANWSVAYRIIFQANKVLEGLSKLPSAEDPLLYKRLKGQALFFRAWQHWRQALMFAPQFDKDKSATDMGVPMKLQTDINAKTIRISVEENYKKILADLLEAAELVDDHDAVKTRPAKAAIHTLIARMYLTMRQWKDAVKYADLALSSPHYSLVDFGEVTNGSYPFKRFGSEVLFHAIANTSYIFSSSRFKTDPELFRSYTVNDYRRQLFFNRSGDEANYKGSYDGSLYPFVGIKLSECFLIKAECEVRMNQVEQGLNTLSKLLESRIEGYRPPEGMSQSEALSYVLSERRKELLLNGIRWYDLKRLNMEKETEKILSKTVLGKVYVLEPNSLKYIFPIPPSIIQMTGIPQNPR
ncbi:RagB/SusD family nutrient uptake outer membrane protein [Sphingobacterium yanglingense]|uniref:SusD-like starch-binding protein associating with outer membrane n=1 Tax=Sphingobacterium yanglingense TaxID=1437280 RepID=A0A4R6WQP7_9SPHI|nr:RagB/SusD family nutrient uptake outer membrane protein [Sphingobacterium yanglingense]TDQ81699.1 SusD-like starch-binding protein associating with outer membrane [Sphingobacterium yanglingense]